MTHGGRAAEEEPMVLLEEAVEQVRRACARLGLLHYTFARTLVEALGEKQGKQVAMNAIKLYGTRIGEKARQEVAARGLAPSPENFQDDLPQFGMHQRREAVSVEGEMRSRVYGCVMGEVWRELGAGELGRIYCYVDPCKYLAYNSEFKLIHHKTLPDGDACCELSVRPATEQDRAELAASDSDLASIDK